MTTIGRGAALAAAFLLAACDGAITNLEIRGGSGEVLFLTQGAPATFVMDALFEGRVVVDDAGCVRLDGPDPATVVWPYRFTLEGNTVHAADGRIVGRLGGSFRLGGGEVPTLAGGDWQSALDRCPGRFWIVGDVPR